MVRVKKRKLKFLCIIGGDDETPRCRSVQSCSPANSTVEQSLLKFEVGKSSSKQRNGNRIKKLLTKRLSNGISVKKRSPSFLAKLMGRGGRSYKTVVLNQKTTNVKKVDHYSDQCTKNAQHFSSVTECKCRDTIETVPEINSHVKEVFEFGPVGLYRYDYYWDDNLHVLRSSHASESEETTVPFRIIFGQHDRLQHSLSYMSESSLIMEATNRMLERFNTTVNEEDVGTVSKGSMLRETPFPFPDEEIRPAESGNIMGLVGVNDISVSPTGLSTILGSCSRDGQGDRHPVNTSGFTSLPSSFTDPDHKRNVCQSFTEKTDSEPVNQCRRNLQKDSFNHEKDIPSKNAKSGKTIQSSQKSCGTYFENEDPAKNQTSASDIDVDAQLSGHESEDVAFHSDCFESVNSRLQDLKKNLHLLKVGSKSISNKLTLIPKVKQIGQRSSVAVPESVYLKSAYMAHVLQTVENDDANRYTSSSSSWKSETTCHPIDPWLFYCLEKGVQEPLKAYQTAQTVKQVDQTEIKMVWFMGFGGLTVWSGLKPGNVVM
ncbi:hypothetical protein E3N88_14518 [Mikania micrantha]|uniref:Uncharacterized protein n=1 Tax=Mikania micrantha TaxID=192012 RepID=A0A5N6P2X7_9ASTR|nr:hypothetical protein E3N88_14518 [Mikania micrantha]